MASKRIKAILTLNDKNFSSNMKKASNGVNGFNRKLKYGSNQVKKFKKDVANSFRSITKSALGLAGAYVGFRAFSSGVKDTTEAAKAQIDAEKKMATVLKQRTNATDKQIKSILELTAAQQGLGVIGDEVQIAGAQQIGTFIKSTKSVETLIPAMNNLLAQQKGLNATQQDAVNVGNMIGKVLQGQVGALTRVGITFTKAQEKVLKYGNEQEKAAMLAKVITDNVGEMNKSLAETDPGKVQQMTNAWGDYKEEIGKKILPLHAQFAGWFFKKIPGIQTVTLKAIDKGVMAFSKVGKAMDKVKVGISGVKKWGIDAWDNINTVVDENRPTLNKIKEITNDISSGLITLKNNFTSAFQNKGAVWFKDKALPAIADGILGVVDKAANLYNFIKNNWNSIEPIVFGIAGAITSYKLAVMATTGVTKIATGVTKGMAAAQGILNTVMNMSPLGMIAIGIGVLIAAGVALYKNWDTIKAKALDLWKGIKVAFSPIGDFFMGIWEGVKAGFKGFINFFISGINTVVGGINSLKIDVPDWVPKFGGKSFGFKIKEFPKFALGTSYFKGGLARINERGGEIVNLPNGSQVIPADKSEKIINNTQNISGLDGLLKLLQEIVQLLRGLGNRKNGEMVININGTNLTVEEILNELVPKLKLALANR